MMAASISRSCGGSGSRRWICLLSMVEGLYTPDAKIDEVLKLKAPGYFRLEGRKVNISRLLVLFLLYFLNLLDLQNKKAGRGASCRPNDCLLFQPPPFETLAACGPFGP